MSHRALLGAGASPNAFIRISVNNVFEVIQQLLTGICPHRLSQLRALGAIKSARNWILGEGAQTTRILIIVHLHGALLPGLRIKHVAVPVHVPDRALNGLVRLD